MSELISKKPYSEKDSAESVLGKNPAEQVLSKKLEKAKNSGRPEYLKKGIPHKKITAGDFEINPQGSDRFFDEINKNNRGEIESVKFNANLSLSDLTKIGGLENYSKYSGKLYQIERVIENSLNKNELSDELLIKVLEWNNDIKNRGENPDDYESYIIKPLAEKRAVSERVVNWLIENSLQDYSLLELVDYGAISQEQMKQWVIKTKNSYLKYELMQKGIIGHKNFSPQEIEKLYFSGNIIDDWRASLYNIAAYQILPYWDADAQKNSSKKPWMKLSENTKSLILKMKLLKPGALQYMIKY